MEVFAAQANFVHGGCLLFVSSARPVLDGTAMLSVAKLWAPHCSRLGRERKDKSAKEKEIKHFYNFAQKASIGQPWTLLEQKQ